MSRVVIQGDASGTGDFTIAAPNSNTDRTLTLPDEAGEVLVTDGTTLVVDNTNNRVGIGTSSPDAKLQTNSGGGAGTTTKHIQLHSAAGEDNVTLRIAGTVYTGATQTSIDFNQNAGTNFQSFIAFGTSPGTGTTERMRIDSSGNLLVGTSTSRTGSDSLSFESANSLIWFQKNGTATQSQVIFQRDTTGTPTIVGSIQTSGTTTTYNTSSDYRLKENVVEITDGIDRVKLLNPSRFNFIADSDTTVDGFLAHEAQAVVPEAVTGTHNEVDDDGNPVMQGIDQSKLVPLLTAALQEAITKIEALEARVTALENA